MDINNLRFLHYCLVLIFCIFFILPSCTKMPVKPSIESDKQIPKDGEVTDAVEPESGKIIEEDIAQSSLIKILSDQAYEFALQENYQDALLIYNQALAIAQDQLDEKEKNKLIAEIDSLLSQTPTKVIQECIEIKNIIIPRSLLLYWLGLNYSLEQNQVKAIETLETFLFEFPNHPYFVETVELVNVIKKSIFKKDTIGCLLPLTGKYAIFGQRALSGIQMAIQELSDRYSRKFKIIIIDTKADPEIAAQGVRTLYKKNVAGIIGPLLNIDPAGEEAQKLQIPLIALTQKHDFPLQGDYLFSNFITPQMQVQTLGAYLFLELGLKKVAVLYPNEKYGKKYMELFWDIADEYDAQIVGVESYDGKKTDFQKPIQKLTGQFYPIPRILRPATFKPDADKPDAEIQIDFQALFIPDSPSNINMILPQLAFNDATGMYLVGTNLWYHESLLKEVKRYSRRAIITDGFFNNSQNQLSMEFTDKFESMFNEKPEFLEAISYDTASILLTFAMDESIDSRQALKDSLQGRRIFEGVTGNTIFDKDGIAHRQLFLMTIKKEKFVEIIR